MGGGVLYLVYFIMVSCLIKYNLYEKVEGGGGQDAHGLRIIITLMIIIFFSRL